MTAGKKRLICLALIGAVAFGSPAHAQFLKDLRSVVTRGVQDEVRGKVERETRSATRCALGEAEDCPTLSREDQDVVVAAFKNCSPMTFRTEHPMVDNFTIEHEIRGIENGRCIYHQSMPSDMKMICAFTEEGRKEAAAALSQSIETGRYQGSMQEAPAFARECEIEMANGYRVPMGATVSSGP